MKIILAILLLLTVTFICFGQHGGKAEPKRIEFAKGTFATVLTENLRNGEEMEYVFAASKGQHVTVRNPQTSLFDFRLFSEKFGVETEYDSSRIFTFEIPETGD